MILWKTSTIRHGNKNSAECGVSPVSALSQSRGKGINWKKFMLPTTLEKQCICLASASHRRDKNQDIQGPVVRN